MAVEDPVLPIRQVSLYIMKDDAGNSTFYAKLPDGSLLLLTTSGGPVYWDSLVGTPPAVSTFENDVPYMRQQLLTNVQADWDQSDSGQLTYIQNKPVLGRYVVISALNALDGYMDIPDSCIPAYVQIGSTVYPIGSNIIHDLTLESFRINIQPFLAASNTPKYDPKTWKLWMSSMN